MKTAQEAGELALSEEIPIGLSRQCDKALDKAVEDAISKGRREVDIALWSEDCKDDDDVVQAYLHRNGYKQVKVWSDYPWYNESYAGKTFIQFSF